MEPSKPQSAASPQQGLTHPVEGCHSEVRSEDLPRRGHDGTNPEAGQQVASEAVDFVIAGPSHAPEVARNTRRGEPDLKTSFTRLQAFEFLTEESKKINGRKGRPKDLSKSERLCLISSGLGENLRSPLSASQENQFATAISRFICKTEKKLKDCKYNMPFFKKKHNNWLSKPFKCDLHQDLFYIESETGCENIPPSHPVVTPRSASSFDSKRDRTYEDLSTRQQLRSRKRLKAILENEPPQKLIKTFSKSISVSGLDLSDNLIKKRAHDLDIIISK